jgi:Holliday junction resolvasome RuvABC DNA-binding subunit
VLSLGAGPAVTALRDGDAKALAKAPGVGLKMAQSLVAAVTLPDELVALLATDANPLAEMTDALVAMGMDATAARHALEEAAAAGVTGEGKLIRTALSALRAA